MYDAIVVGLGAMGSSAALALARRGARVLGVDRYAPPHTLGSTHGRTRIIREAYYEHPCYVPLVQRAYEVWDRIAREAGATLYRRTGGLMIGPPDGELVAGAVASVRAHGLPHEMLDTAALRRRHPEFRVPDGYLAVSEPRAGLLFPERCVDAMHALARNSGAELVGGVTVDHWTARGNEVRVRAGTHQWRARTLVLAAGPWMPELLGDPGAALVVERQTSFWFAPRDDRSRFDASVAPITLWDVDGDRLFATFPDVGDGVKVMIHHEGVFTTPTDVDRVIGGAEVESMRNLMRRYIPALDGAYLDGSVCLYTNTPDRHFLIDHHPAYANVLVASPCSGHGFKFASAIGEVLADVALDGETTFDLTPFRFARLAT